MYLVFIPCHTAFDHQIIVVWVMGVIALTWFIFKVPHVVPLVFQPIAQQLMLNISWDNTMAMLLLEC